MAADHDIQSQNACQTMRFSWVQGLKCADCGETVDFGYYLKCPRCGGLLDLTYDLQATSLAELVDSGFHGMWRYHRILPVADPSNIVTLGEGSTPLIRAQRLARSLGVRELYLKYEGTNPTGTVKDRTSSTAVSSARQFRARTIAVVSTGNAGVSIATYARRGEVRSVVFCYHRGDPIKMNHMSLMATRFCVFEGEYDDLIHSVDQCVTDGLAFDGGATRNPFKHEGKKTIAYEVVEALKGAPDFFFSPVGVGEIFIATHRAFVEMQQLGIVERAPTLVCCQSDQASPVVDAFRKGGAFQPMSVKPTIAKGVSVGDPGPKGERVLRILRENSGLAVTVSDEEVQEAQRLLSENEGLWAGPTGVVSLAGLVRVCRQQKINPDSTSVCVVSETGLTSSYPPVKSRLVGTELEEVRRVFSF
jgi:threonine synthase